MRRLTLILVALALAGPSVAAAEEWPPLDTVPEVEVAGNGDVALVVAIEDYAFLPDVPGAARNAADWERFLSDGIGVEKVLTLTNQQATREEILTFAHRAASAVEPGARLWFVFIGHGGPASDGSDGLLIGVDGQQNAKSMSTRGVAQEELLGVFSNGDQGNTVVLIDACFSGRDGSGEALAKGTMPVLPVNPAPDVDADTVIMTAAKADEFAGDLPGAERPAFSYLVLGAMRGWADDGDGAVTAEEAVTFARREMLEISGRQQTPQLVGARGLTLSRGVSETLSDFADDGPAVDPEPGLAEPSASEPTVDAATTANAQSKEATDGIPDNPFYASITAGPGAVDNFDTLGFVTDATAGVKFNGFSGVGPEWRAGLRFALSFHRNNDTPEAGETIGNGAEVFPDDDIDDTSVTTFAIGPEVGRAWRRETGTGLFGDTLFVASVFGLYGSQSDVCYQWRVDTSDGRSVVCDRASDISGPGAGVSIGANIGVIRLSAQFAAFLVNIDLLSSVTAGFTFDI